MNRIPALFVVIACGFSLWGCGSSTPNCPVDIPMVVTPASGTADHTVVPPGNQVQFTASAPSAGVGCKVNNGAISEQNWTVSDPADVQIAPRNGTATCINATPGAVTVSVAVAIGVQQASGTAQLTCK